MAPTLELPTGETVTPDDVFLFNGYPYRFVPSADDRFAFELSPLYWGGGEMDVPFPDREHLAAQWGPDSRGTLSEAEWRDWLTEARADDRFDEEELAAVEREVLGGGDGGLLAGLRRRLGLQ
ncbi:MAG: hypothetical protein V5A61_10480 [Haloarculaceae archaeon]|mgnify:CR=1 FL=1|jgi:hypothetical protein